MKHLLTEKKKPQPPVSDCLGVLVHKRFGFHSTRKKRNYEKSSINFKMDFYSYTKPSYLQCKEHATAFTRFRTLNLNVKPFQDPRDLNLIPVYRTFYSLITNL